ncbi:BGTF surface domain-containing protein [Halonotius terrestris]|nr:BGTF surface domain-containing protein [Halonotius terrestris]
MTERNYSEKLRAVFLAAIMVTSVVGGTVAFTGAVSAGDAGPAGGVPGDGNVNYESNLVFQGQNNLAAFNAGDVSDGDTVVLRRVTAEDGTTIDSSQFVEEYTVEGVDGPGDEVIDIDTDDLEADDYFVVDQDGDVTTPTTAGTFEVTVQDLSAEFDDDEVLPGTFSDSTVTLDVSSGRSTFDLNVSADGDLSDQELFNIHAAAQINSLSGVSVNDNGEVVISGSGETFSSPYALFREEVTSADTGAANTGSGDDTPLSTLGVSVNNPDSSSGSTIEKFGHNGDVVTGSGDTVTVGGITLGFYAQDQDSDTADFDEKVLVRSGGFDADVSFVGQDEGSYDFDFEAADTEASATASVSVQERDADASFEDGTQAVGAGDIAEFNVTLSDNDETYVQIGGENSNFIEVLYLKADDSDEPMEVRFNTRLLGTTGNVQQSDVYDTTNVDTIESAIYSASAGTPSDITAAGSASLYEDDGTGLSASTTSAGSTAFEAYLDAAGIIDASSNGGETVADQLDRPLQPTDYQIAVAGYTGESYVFDADPGGEANNQLASQTLELTQPEIGDITIHTAPEESADDTSDVSALVDAATPREEVALDDRLVVQVEATGIYGALVADAPVSSSVTPGNNGGAGPQDVNFDILEDGASTSRLQNLVDSRENVDFEVAGETGTGNQAPLEVDLGASDSDTFLVLDNDGGQFFLVTDTSSDSAFANGDAPDEETEFEAFMEYDADDGDNRFEFANAGGSGSAGTASAPFSPRGSAYQNYPYLLQGETVSSTSALTLAPRTIEYDNLNEDEQVQVANAEGAEVSATTNVAPGTDTELRLRSTDASSSFQVGNDVNISEDGSISTTYDLSNQEVGDLFDANFRVEGSSVDTTEGVIVESVSMDDGEEMNETDDSEEDMDDGEEDMDDGEEMNETDDGESEDGTSEETPGFGAIVALVALIGAALLATRRQN